MSEEHDHAAWVARLVDAATRGTIVDLRSGVPAHLYDPATADQWPADRHIPARAIRDVLTGDHAGFAPDGLRIVGARITGDVDFAHITFDHPLHLIRCRIDSVMNLNSVSLRQLTLSGSYILSLALNGANIRSGLVADRITTFGVIHADSAIIGSHLVMVDAHLHNPGRPVLVLDGATIKGALFADRISTDGEIRALGTTIGSQLGLNDAHLHNPGRPVLVLDGATTKGALFALGITAYGEIRALGTTIGGQLGLNDAHLHNPGHDVLALDGATITGGLFADRISTDGEIDVNGATINGQFSLNRAYLHNPGQRVLSLEQATVTGGLFAKRISTDGEIRAISATISGQLGLSAAHLHNPGQSVLTLTSATISGALFADRISTDGEVHANGATINGHVILNGAHLHNPGSRALDLYGATVTGALLAVDYDHYATDRSVTSAFRVNGRISARRARLENHLDLRDAKPQPSGTNQLTIDLEGAVVRELTLPVEGPTVVNLSRAKITNLNTPENREPRYPVLATGWEISDVHGRIRTDHAAATRWLSHDQDSDVSPQPWHALAAVYERNGHPAEARRLRFTAANKVTKAAPPATKLQRWTYRLVAGHGYYPLLAAVWLIVALMGGFALVEVSREHFVPTSPSAATTLITVTADTTGGGKAPVELEQSRTITGADDCATHPQYPCLDSFSYALTGVIPAATGTVRPDWTISTAAPLWVKAGIPALRVLAWIFTAILLAGVTGLLRKSS